MFDMVIRRKAGGSKLTEYSRIVICQSAAVVRNKTVYCRQVTGALEKVTKRFSVCE